MDQLASQLAVLTAVLTGFAFTFVGGLLSLPADSKAFVLTFGAALAASVSLLVASVGFVFLALGSAGKFISSSETLSLHGLSSLAFLVGVFSFLFAAGSVGWTKGKLIGRISTTVAILGFISLIWVFAPFIRVQW